MADKKAKTVPQLVRGMRDILPEEEGRWRWIGAKLDSLAEQFGFSRMETPLLEEASLFERSVGAATDIVSKEMYTLTTKEGGASLALRPEGTASVARAYITHGMHNRPQPVRLWYYGTMFRHDRPQSGRYRQFVQAGWEIMGDGHPAVDAELILLASSIAQRLAIPVRIEVSSVGHPECRASYARILKDYTKDKKTLLCEDCRVRRETNPLRLLDCKVEGCIRVMERAPQIIDHLCEEDKNHFVQVLEYLDEASVPYTLNPRIVRGLDYYTRTAFEIFPEATTGAPPFSALGGGGRYDLLVESLGGRPTPACGFAVGVERLLEALPAEISSGLGTVTRPPDVFLAQLGEVAKKRSFILFRRLIEAELRVRSRMSKDNLKGQLEAAHKEGARFVLILGQQEAIDGTVLVRDMDSGVQEPFPFDTVVDEVKKRLGR